jgi:hypothetical protein
MLEMKKKSLGMAPHEIRLDASSYQSVARGVTVDLSSFVRLQDSGNRGTQRLAPMGTF